MKAILLVGGLGTRLRPITDTIPKCLVPIDGKPVIDYWVEALQDNGIREVLVNLHHFPEMVKEHLLHAFPSVHFTFFHEKELLGSAGTIRDNFDFFANDESVLVIYGDNFTEIDLGDFIRFNNNNAASGSIALFTTPNPTACGIVELNNEKCVIDFEEKPKEPKSNLANAGLYIFKKDIFPIFLSQDPSLNPFDIGFHILPRLVGKISGWKINGFFIDIGTPENLQKARDYISAKKQGSLN
jgi:mannose-1-phosphate guanylyltransferase